MIAGMPYFSKELDIAFDLPVSSNAFSSSVIAAITTRRSSFYPSNKLPCCFTPVSQTENIFVLFLQARCPEASLSGVPLSCGDKSFSIRPRSWTPNISD